MNHSTQIQVYEFHDYKEFLRRHLSENERRGGLARLARIAACQSAYLWRVLYQDCHLTPEQGLALSEELFQDTEERDYFFNLVLANRAGSDALKNYYRARLSQHSVKAQSHAS